MALKTSNVSWPKLRPLACGCQGDYVTAENGGVRLPNANASAARTSQDAVQLLQTGVHVLYYNDKDQCFQSRIIKVDMQLSFLFVMQEPPSKQSMHQQQKEPLVVRLFEIEDVVGATAAMKTCQLLNIHDDNLSEQTALCVYHGKMAINLDFVRPDQALVLMSPPHLKLLECIKTAVEIAKKRFAGDQDDEEGMRLKDRGLYLDEVRIPNVGGVFFHDATTLEMEFTVRSNHVKHKTDAKKKPLVHPVVLPLAPSSVHLEISKLIDRLGVLPPVDITRFSLVLYELALHRHWIGGDMRLFPGGLYNFCQDPTGIAATFRVNQDVSLRILSIPGVSHKVPDVHFYANQALKATVLSLRHLLLLEEVFFNIENGSVMPVQEPMESFLEAAEVHVFPFKVARGGKVTSLDLSGVGNGTKPSATGAKAGYTLLEKPQSSRTPAVEAAAAKAAAQALTAEVQAYLSGDESMLEADDPAVTAYRDALARGKTEREAQRAADLAKTVAGQAAIRRQTAQLEAVRRLSAVQQQLDEEGGDLDLEALELVLSVRREN
eukprot:TRINITY_DN109547_c0_g1_i1.p1 TRINITY_DN109547_c0_g1~~TRINITY_DN109547_c0_g1_i1.p1  ORF type:complete len:548 (-),score=128.60 TRINITY_DN109547_c0_g1_i1:70-1713(-)